MSRQILESHREIWARRPLTRELYARWFAEVRGELSKKRPVVEIGAGTGNFKEFMPEALATDLVHCGWLDAVHDAMDLPYASGAVGNFVLIDAIHHVEDPVRALGEMERCLARGGRIVVFDVFISPFSYLYYNFLHKEAVDMGQDLFKPVERSGKEPFESNQAIATLLFFKGIERFKARFPGLKVVKRELREFLLYPLSGGFEGRRLAPVSMKGALEAVDRAALRLFAPFIAARCLVVLEKAGR